MHKNSTRLWLEASLVLAVYCFSFNSTAVLANTWERCELKLAILAHDFNPHPTLKAKVTDVRKQTRSAECPKIGEVISFEPETRDYQSILPRKKWPQKGAIVQWRYIYLDGICKNDGDPIECRIKHYPQI